MKASKKIQKELLKQFDIVSSEQKSNNSGYGCLETTYIVHHLSDGTRVIESTPFSASKARSMFVLNHYDGDKLIKAYLEN